MYTCVQLEIKYIKIYNLNTKLYDLCIVFVYKLSTSFYQHGEDGLQ